MTKMDFCKVVAIVRTDKIEEIERYLSRHGIKGVTVSRVKGYGEYANFFRRDWLTSHMRMEIYTVSAKADQTVELLMECAHTGLEGDGIIAVEPVKSVYRIRTRSMILADEI